MPKIDIAAVPERKGVGLIRRRSMRLAARAHAPAAGRCRRPDRFRRQPDAPAARQLVEPAPLAQP